MEGERLRVREPVADNPGIKPPDLTPQFMFCFVLFLPLTPHKYMHLCYVWCQKCKEVMMALLLQRSLYLWFKKLSKNKYICDTIQLKYT